MSWQGWAFLIVGWGIVGGLFIWCFWKVLRGNKTKNGSEGKTV